MALRRRRNHHRKNPRGSLLAFVAVAMQAMLPFFVAVALVRASNPAYADSIPICSSLGTAGHSDNGTNGEQHANCGDCPICTALAAGQAFLAPPTVPLPVPVSLGRIVLTTTDTPRLALLAASPYQSRGPPLNA
jgi:hypothetical protein